MVKVGEYHTQTPSTPPPKFCAKLFMQRGDIMRGLSSTILVLAGTMAVAERMSVNFNYGWRFIRAWDKNDAPVSWSTFPHDLSNKTCPDFQVTPIGREDSPGFDGAGDCARGCAADPSCYGYVYVSDAPWYWTQCMIALESSALSSCTDGGEYTRMGRYRDSIPALPSFEFAQVGFDDSSWDVVDVPHDFIKDGNYSAEANTHEGYLPRNMTGWYRKHFTIPSDWSGSVVRIVFGAAFQRASVYFNGDLLIDHALGYTPFEITLPPSTTKFGADNVLAVRIDASYGSGHWYEGGGIWQDVVLEVSKGPRFVRDGVFVPSEGDGKMIPVHAEVTLDGGMSASVKLKAVLQSDNGSVVAEATSPLHNVTTNSTISLTLSPKSPLSLWSIQAPHLYNITVSLEASSGTLLDQQSWETGFRYTTWSTSDPVFTLNGNPVNLLGFCDHDDWTGVGSAVPPRINLFRMQALRAMGANHRRFSHNPPPTALPDIASRIGILTMSENRDFGLEQFLPFVRDFARRDRNQPSVLLWSVSNEVEGFATRKEVVPMFADTFRESDPTRNVSGNIFPVPSTPVELYESLDVVGLSHQTPQSYAQIRQSYPTKPLFSSEGSSCLTQFAEAIVNKSNDAWYDDFNQPCATGQFLWSYGVDYVGSAAGVWTASSYWGESPPFPGVSSDFGQLTIDGVAKPAAFWYASIWLANVSSTSPNRPSLPNGDLVRIVEQWTDEGEGNPPSVIHVFSSTSKVALYINDKLVGMQSVASFNYTTFSVKYEAGNITAVGLDDSNNPTASDTRLTPSSTPSHIQLRLMAPSPATGTGSSIIADGQDAAIVRAIVVDKNGRRVTSSSLPVSFKVLSGPGRILGTGNPSPTQANTPPTSLTHPSYHGIATAVVGVTVDAMSPNRDIITAIDRDQGPVTVHQHTYTPTPITVQATAPNLPPQTITIPVSTDPSHSVNSVAAATGKSASFTIRGFAEN